MERYQGLNDRLVQMQEENRQLYNTVQVRPCLLVRGRAAQPGCHLAQLSWVLRCLLGNVPAHLVRP